MVVALKGDYQQAEELARSMMEKSYALWDSQLSTDDKFDGKLNIGGM